MDFFEEGSEGDEEIKDIIEDILDLYDDMNGRDSEELIKSSNAYYREYEKILKKFGHYFDMGLFGSEAPKYLVELIEEVKQSSMLMGSTRIIRIKMGLRKISRKLKIKLPEKKLELKKGEARHPPLVINTSQFLNNEINISNDIKIEVNQAVKDFEEEIGKVNPSPSRLKALFETIKKGAGHGAIKIIELLLIKHYGLG